MLIPLTTDFHFTTLPSVEDAAIISAMVFCGVHESSNTLYVVDCKQDAGVVQWQNVSFPS
jgi:hypothetical protein